MANITKTAQINWDTCNGWMWNKLLLLVLPIVHRSVFWIGHVLAMMTFNICIRISSSGPPEENILCLTRCRSRVLISCSWGRPRFLVGLAHSCGPAASTQTLGATCLLICTAVFSSSPAQPQARATSSTGSEVVVSRTGSPHSTGHCGWLDQRQSWPAQRPLPFISLAARPVPVVMPEGIYSVQKKKKNPQGHISTCISKMSGIPLGFQSHVGKMAN